MCFSYVKAYDTLYCGSTLVENLSSLGRIAPSKLKKHKVALVNLLDLRARGLHYVVIRMPPSDDPVRSKSMVQRFQYNYLSFDKSFSSSI